MTATKMARLQAPSVARARGVADLSARPRPLAGGHAAHARIENDDRWRFTASPLIRSERSSWELLMAQHDLPGNVRWARANSCDAPELVADVLVTTESTKAREREALRGMQLALTGRGAEVEPEESVAPVNAALAAVCAETGWSHAERDGGAFAVALECGNDTHSARLVATPRGHVAIETPLARVAIADFSELARTAIADFLLAMSAALRHVRPAAIITSHEIEFVLEARFPTTPSAAELATTLSACSVGCSTCARETSALLDSEIAKAYLAARVGAP
ncbi:MAG: hypothetical protein ACKVX7_09615 [Planctomycetota bacterium]